MEKAMDIQDSDLPVSLAMNADESAILALVSRVVIIPAAAFIPSSGSQDAYAFNYIDADLKGTGCLA